MEGPIAIRFALLADHPGAIRRIAEWYHGEWGYLSPSTGPEDIERRLRRALTRDAIPLAILALEGDEVVGVLELKFREMAIYPEREHWLGGVYVPVSHRGKGIAAGLVRHAAETARSLGIRTLSLQTEKPNGGLYARLGWVPVERVTYRGVEVLVMERHLSDAPSSSKNAPSGPSRPASIAPAGIREATLEDVTAIAELVNRAYRVEAPYVLGDRTTESAVAGLISAPGSAFLVLEAASSAPLATVLVKEQGDRGYFGLLAVDPERQGEGLGKAMVAAVESRCRGRGCRHLDLSVLSPRSELVTFYRRLGFQPTGTKECPDAERLRVEAHLILMSKALGD